MPLFKPLSPTTWNDILTLFGEKGACGGCWCMYWRLQNKIYESNKGEKNKEILYNLINQKQPLGVIAFEGDVPIGWCSISPKTSLVRLRKSRYLRNSEWSESIWSITCLFIRSENRRTGLSSELISAAAEFAFENGASVVEAYPIGPKKKNMAAVFAWCGFVKSFEKSDFKISANLSEHKVTMRLYKLPNSSV